MLAYLKGTDSDGVSSPQKTFEGRPAQRVENVTAPG